jgi:hypothetical protein
VGDDLFCVVKNDQGRLTRGGGNVLYGLIHGKVWWRDDIEAWIRAHRPTLDEE